jgi:hypothetical protein
MTPKKSHAPPKLSASALLLLLLPPLPSWPHRPH